MGLIGRIWRSACWAWLCRAKWRNLAEARQRVINNRDARIEDMAAEYRIVCSEVRRLREQQERRFRETGKQVAKIQVAGQELARIMTAHGLVGCRLEALREKMGIGVLKEESTDGHGPPRTDTDDFWTIATGTGTRVTFRRHGGHGPGCCTVVVTPRAPMNRGWEIPVSPVMSRALMDFLERLHGPTPQTQACADGAQVAAALTRDARRTTHDDS